MSRTWAAILALVLTGSLFWWLANLRHEQRREKLAAKEDDWKKEWKQWFSGLFVGADNDPSLSLFQVFLWTVVTVWGLLYVFTITGNLLSLTQEMLWLLGIAGVGSIAARWIAGSTPGGSTSQAPGSGAGTGAPVAGVTTAPPPLEFWQILSTNGRFDLLKLQIFVFTLMVAVYVIWRIADTGVFPALDSNTLLLLGVSQGVYIGGKMAGTTSLSRAQTLKGDLDVKTGQKQPLLDEQATLLKKQSDLKAATPPQDLSSEDKRRLDQLPEMINIKQKEISDINAEYEKALKGLGLKPV